MMRNFTFTSVTTELFPSFSSSYNTSSYNDMLNNISQLSYQAIRKEHIYGIYALNGTLSLVGVIGNSIVFITVLIKNNSPSKIFLLNLSILHILMLTICFPLYALQILYDSKLPGLPFLYKTIPPFSDVISGVFMLCLTALSIIRYRKIIHAMATEITVCKATLLTIFIWMATIVIILIPQLFNTYLLNTRIYPLCLVSFWYLLPLLIISYTYCHTKIFLSSHMALEWMKGSGHAAIITNRVLRSRIAMRMLAPISFSSISLLLPINTWFIVLVFAKSYSIKYQTIYSLIIASLLVLNSMLFPLLYYKYSLQFRIDVRLVFKSLSKHIRGTRTYDISNPDSYNARLSIQKIINDKMAGKCDNGDMNCYIYTPHVHAIPLVKKNNNCDNNHSINDDIEELIESEIVLRETVL